MNPYWSMDYQVIKYGLSIIEFHLFLIKGIVKENNTSNLIDGCG